MNDKLSLVDWIVIGSFLVMMLGFGAYLALRIKSFKEYFLAGGALSTPLLICTLVSTYYGLDVTFGTSETSFYYGLSAWVWYCLPYYLFIGIAAVLIASRLRQHDASSLPELLEQKYGRGMSVLSAAACFVYSAPILAIAGLMTMTSWLGVNEVWGVMLIVGVCAAYTSMGGLWADTLSDTVQFVLMCVTLAVALPLAVNWVGGWDFIEHLPRSENGEQLYLTHHGGLGIWVLLAWALSGTTVLVEPAFYQRVFAARDTRSITRALLLGIVLWAAYDWIVVMIGMLAQAAVQQGMLSAELEGKQALLEVSVTVLPMGLRGIMIGGIIAAAMSTIDSYSLLAAGNLIYDIGNKFRKEPLSDRQLMWAMRIGVVVVLLFSVALAMSFERLRHAWLFMASLLSAAALVPTMALLFAKPKRGAGLWSGVFGVVGLFGYLIAVTALGSYNAEEDSIELIVRSAWGDIVLGQFNGVVAALPCSVLGMLIGQWWHRNDLDEAIGASQPKAQKESS